MRTEWLWRVAIVRKPGPRKRKAFSTAHFAVAASTEGAAALALASSHVAPNEVLRITVELWGLTGRGSGHMESDLTAAPDSVPSPEALAAAFALLGEDA